MKRALLLAAAGIAAIAVVLPATAGAASFTGVVIAKKQARHAVVTASKNGVVRTTRVRGALGRYRIGRHVFVRGAVLPDGTYAASKIQMLGPKARGVRVHGSVVWATAKQLVVSAGASVFSLALRGGTLAPSASGGLQPGDDLDLSADVKGGALQTSADRLHKTGHSDELVLEGIYLATADDGTIELAVVHRGRVFVNVPGDVFVPEFKPGDVIALKVKVEADGSFTLVKADDESGGGDGDGDGDHIGKHQFSVNGVLSSIDDNNVSVSAGDGDSKTVTCAVPDGFDLSGYEVGQRVVMTCKYDEGKPVLIALQKKESGGEYLYAIGDITDLPDGSITVQGDGNPVTCAVPDGFDLSDYAEGDSVVIKCDKEDGVWTLKGIEHRTQPPPPPAYLKVTGPITDLGEDITVQGEHEPVTCAVPDGADLSGFHVSDYVSMKCVVTDDGLRLKRLQSGSSFWEAT